MTLMNAAVAVALLAPVLVVTTALSGTARQLVVNVVGSFVLGGVVGAGRGMRHGAGRHRSLVAR